MAPIIKEASNTRVRVRQTARQVQTLQAAEGAVVAYSTQCDELARTIEWACAGIGTVGPEHAVFYAVGAVRAYRRMREAMIAVLDRVPICEEIA